jgi:hypothetical protein
MLEEDSKLFNAMLKDLRSRIEHVSPEIVEESLR